MTKAELNERLAERARLENECRLKLGTSFKLIRDRVRYLEFITSDLLQRIQILEDNENER